MSENLELEEIEQEEQLEEREQRYESPEHYIKDTGSKVSNILQEFFPEFMSFGVDAFTITRGSTQVLVKVKHFLKDETIIVCYSNVVRGAQITPKLMHYLLRKNAELQFGAFSLMFDGTITFSHSITGKNLDPNELVTTLSSVAFIADYYDDIIVDMAGGRRAKDHIDNMKAMDSFTA